MLNIEISEELSKYMINQVALAKKLLRQRMCFIENSIRALEKDIAAVERFLHDIKLPLQQRLNAKETAFMATFEYRQAIFEYQQAIAGYDAAKKLSPKKEQELSAKIDTTTQKMSTITLSLQQAEEWYAETGKEYRTCLEKYRRYVVKLGDYKQEKETSQQAYVALTILLQKMENTNLPYEAVFDENILSQEAVLDENTLSQEAVATFHRTPFVLKI